MNTAGATTVAAAIVKLDEDEPTPDLSAFANYTEEEVLWTWGHRFGAATDDGQRVEIDCQARRKIKNTDTIGLYIGTFGASITYSTEVRGLMSLR